MPEMGPLGSSPTVPPWWAPAARQHNVHAVVTTRVCACAQPPSTPGIAAGCQPRVQLAPGGWAQAVTHGECHGAHVSAGADPTATTTPCCRCNEPPPASWHRQGDCIRRCFMACGVLAHCAFTSVWCAGDAQGAPGCYGVHAAGLWRQAPPQAQLVLQGTEAAELAALRQTQWLHACIHLPAHRWVRRG